MSLLNTIQTDLKTALKQKDQAQLDALRFIVSQVKNAQIEKQSELNDNEVIKIIQKEVKKRQEAINIMKKANRIELVKSEKQKLSFLQKYLPQPLTEKELEEIIKAVVENNPEQKNNFGFLMKTVMGQTAGRADGALIAQMLKKFIS
jgi:uncharacterized protein YqeY